MTQSTLRCQTSPAQFIAGQWCDGQGEKRITNTNPFDGSTVTELNAIDRQQLDQAVESARRGRETMAELDPATRRKIMLDAASWLEEHREAFCTLSAMEAGSTRLKAMLELDITIGQLLEASSYPMRMNGTVVQSVTPGKRSQVIREPLGVVGVISPFNFPLNLSMRSVAAALATGNSVLLKPDRRTYLTGGLLIAEMFEAAGLPADGLNVVVGESAMVGETMTSHPDIASVSFTGSTQVGQQLSIECAKHFKKSSMELAGNNPMLVLSDADVERAAEAAVFGTLMHQGQICMSVNRLIVSKPLYQPMVEALAQRIKQIKAGDPSDENVIIGPLIDDKQAGAVIERIEKSVQAGARLVHGGTRDGNVVAPTLLVDVTGDMPAAAEEMFGPVITVLEAQDDDDAVAMANVADAALVASVFTSAGRDREPLIRKLNAGMVHFNDQTVNDEANTLFTGLGPSGNGHYNGHWGLESYTRERWISDQGERYRPFPF